MAKFIVLFIVLLDIITIHLTTTSASWEVVDPCGNNQATTPECLYSYLTVEYFFRNAARYCFKDKVGCSNCFGDSALPDIYVDCCSNIIDTMITQEYKDAARDAVIQSCGNETVTPNRGNLSDDVVADFCECAEEAVADYRFLVHTRILCWRESGLTSSLSS